MICQREGCGKDITSVKAWARYCSKQCGVKVRLRKYWANVLGVKDLPPRATDPRTEG